MHYIRWNNGEEIVGLTEREMYKMLWEKTGTVDPRSGLCLAPKTYGEVEGEPNRDPDDTTEEEVRQAAAVYRKMLIYAVEGCKHLLWKTAFELNRPEVSATMAADVTDQLRQLAADLEVYEREAKRLGIDK